MKTTLLKLAAGLIVAIGGGVTSAHADISHDLQRPPPRYYDLCEGYYVGNYLNPQNTHLQYYFRRIGGDRIHVTINISSWPETLYGYGTCRQYRNTAEFSFDGNGVPHHGRIRDGFMHGQQLVNGGFQFQAWQR